MLVMENDYQDGSRESPKFAQQKMCSCARASHPDEGGVVVPGADGHHVAVDNDRLVHILRSALRDVERTVGHGGDRAAANDVRGANDFGPVAHGGHRLVDLEAAPRDAHQVLVILEVFRRAAARDEQAGIILRLHVAVAISALM